MRIRIDETVWTKLQSDLQPGAPVESAAVLLGEVLGAEAERVIVVRHAQLVSPEGYEIRRADQLRISPVTLNRLTRLARDRGWSILTMHTHGSGASPRFSWADDNGDARLMPAFANQVPNVPHGSMVLNTAGKVRARLFERDAAPTTADLVSIGKVLRVLSDLPTQEDARFHRQQLALGKAGQAQLRSLRVAIVGLGGTGSVAAMQLCHLGVGELLLVDGDPLEASNLSRVVGARTSDVGRIAKVDIAARYIVETGMPVSVRIVAQHLAECNVGLLAGADVVISCVDRHVPRALLNSLAYHALVPTIDIGTAFRVDPEGRLVGDAGRVVVAGPGRPCLNCWGHISPVALRIEAMEDHERESLAEEGYIQGADAPEPAVVAFNGAVASAAVIELIRLVTAFAGAEDPPHRLAFSFRDGTVRRNRLAGRVYCDICGGREREAVTPPMVAQSPGGRDGPPGSSVSQDSPTSTSK